MVIAVRNSQENNKKRNWRVKFRYTLQQTNAMLKILNVVINVSLKHSPHIFITMSQTIFLSPLKTSNEAVNLSATTELNHTVCERVINNQQRSFLHEHAH